MVFDKLPKIKIIYYNIDYNNINLFYYLNNTHSFYY